MVRDEGGRDVAELVRRMLVTSCHVDPPHAFVSVLERMSESTESRSETSSADSGYAHRVPEHWAAPLRQIGASLVTDLHPFDRGPKGTHGGAVIFNGALYCPSTPKALFDLGPLARDATKERIQAHDQLTAELDRYRLGRISKDDSDGYHRAMCPAALGKCRCPLRPESLAIRIRSSRGFRSAGAPTCVLHPKDPHRRTRSRPEDRSETSLSLQGASALIRETNRSRTHQCDDQGPGQNRCQPWLVPAHGTGADHRLHRVCPCGSQPAGH